MNLKHYFVNYVPATETQGEAEDTGGLFSPYKLHLPLHIGPVHTIQSVTLQATAGKIYIVLNCVGTGVSKPVIKIMPRLI